VRTFPTHRRKEKEGRGEKGSLRPHHKMSSHIGCEEVKKGVLFLFNGRKGKRKFYT